MSNNPTFFLYIYTSHASSPFPIFRKEYTMHHKPSILITITLLLLVLICATICHSSGPTYSGEVVSIIDGDTIHVREYATKELHKGRLAGIDAPELDQPYGHNAKAALEAVLKYHTVQVQVQAQDKYQREIATVSSKGADISAFMLRYGFAWHYKHFDSSTLYAQLEHFARSQHLGLWAYEGNVPPWVWRMRKMTR